MNYTIFFTENREFVTEIYKEKRVYGFSDNGKYICHLVFSDILRTPVLDIQCSEKQLYGFMATLFNVSQDIGCILSDISYFTINNITCLVIVKDVPFDSPSEDDPKIALQFFEDNPIYGRVSRLYLEMSLSFLEDFIFNIYSVLEDINYLPDLGSSVLNEIMEED